MKKVLALSTSYPLRPESISGVFVHSLYKAMANSWSIDVLCPDDSRPSGGILDGITVTPVRYMPKQLQVLGGAGGILPSLKLHPFKALLLPMLLISMLFHALIKARSVCLIHANWAICGIIGAVAGRLYGKPVVLTLRGSDVEKACRSTIFRWQLRAAVAGSDYTVCVSEAMMRRVVELFPHHAGKLGYCHNGVDDLFFSARRAAPGPDSSLRVMAVGALIPVKGFDVLLRALKSLTPHLAIQTTIVGEGPERSNLQARIAEYGLESMVVLQGEVAHENMPALMAGYDVFVLSSHAEGRPNVVVEAVAAGLPVISSDLPGVGGLVVAGDNGWLYPKGDARALAEVLVEAMSARTELPDMGRRGRERIRVQGSWATTARYYDNLFRTLVAGGTP
ncbi:MAG: glycosyltransferase family 4 protein [Arenimonas sp.]